LFKDDQRVLKGPLVEKLAGEFDVETAIFERDFLLNAIVWSNKGDVATAYRQYIAGGRSDAERTAEIIKSYFSDRLARAHPKTKLPELSILDFACGYGRVGRHFRNVLPEVRYVGMDVHADAVRFNREKLGLEMLRSALEAQDVFVSQKFDFIFALSFFSHIRDGQFLAWLIELHAMLKPEGILMFTTHGRMSHRLFMPELVVDDRGYGMMESSEQFDLSTDFYIHAVTYKEYVDRMIDAVKGLQLLRFSEGDWFGHQDIYIVRNIAPAGLKIERFLRPVTSALRRIKGVSSAART
jgi:SAM-dependent methyltransferase